ncbi:MAG: hypothetical protein NW205_13565 [Hyphomicrobiaceae bacterium]|nr:hypothetical protein [Hyphomicrobiaceae bacterium]
MRTPFAILPIAIAALALAASPARAVDAIVPFTGLVTSTCVLTVGTPGVLAAGAGLDTLSSSAAGGIPGTVTALTTGSNFRISTIAPSNFSIAPPGGGDGVNFSASYRATGATSIGDTLGLNETRLGLGVSILTVNLAAQKSGGAFPGGAYAAEVVVRCE